MTAPQELQGLCVVELRTRAVVNTEHLHAEVQEGRDQTVVDLDPAKP